MLRSRTRPLDHDVCGVMMSPGASQSGEPGGSGSSQSVSRTAPPSEPLAQGPEQGALVDEAAASHVDEPGARLHLGQAPRVHELVGRWR